MLSSKVFSRGLVGFCFGAVIRNTYLSIDGIDEKIGNIYNLLHRSDRKNDYGLVDLKCEAMLIQNWIDLVAQLQNGRWPKNKILNRAVSVLAIWGILRDIVTVALVITGYNLNYYASVSLFMGLWLFVSPGLVWLLEQIKSPKRDNPSAIVDQTRKECFPYVTLVKKAFIASYILALIIYKDFSYLVGAMVFLVLRFITQSPQLFVKKTRKYLRLCLQILTNLISCLINPILFLKAAAVVRLCSSTQELLFPNNPSSNNPLVIG